MAFQGHRALQTRQPLQLSTDSTLHIQSSAQGANEFTFHYCNFRAIISRYLMTDKSQSFSLSLTLNQRSVNYSLVIGHHYSVYFQIHIIYWINETTEEGKGNLAETSEEGNLALLRWAVLIQQEMIYINIHSASPGSYAKDDGTTLTADWSSCCTAGYKSPQLQSSDQTINKTLGSWYCVIPRSDRVQYSIIWYRMISHDRISYDTIFYRTIRIVWYRTTNAARWTATVTNNNFHFYSPI